MITSKGKGAIAAAVLGLAVAYMLMSYLNPIFAGAPLSTGSTWTPMAAIALIVAGLVMIMHWLFARDIAWLMWAVFLVSIVVGSIILHFMM